MNLPEEKQTLANEIITDQQKESEKLKPELHKLKNENSGKIDRDRENAMFEVEDTIDKIKFLVDDFMEQYGFNSTEEMDEEKRFYFAYNKEFMTMKLLILSDYANKARQKFKALEAMEQKA